jgi:hypothetical protein
MRYFVLFVIYCCACPAVRAQAPAPTDYRSPLDSTMTLSLAGNFGEPREDHFHSGVDFRVGGQPGARLRAVADGYIARLSVSPGGYGKAVYIRHPNGTTSVYAHLHAFPPKVKKYIEGIQYAQQRFAVNETLDSTAFPVKRGQLVGIAGNSGNSFGAHLHFELRETATDKTLNMIPAGVFSMPDDIPPKIHDVVFYAYRRREGIPDIAPLSSYADDRTARDRPVAVPDTFFVAVDVDDRQNGPSGLLGVHRLLVKLDGDTLFAYRIDGFLFEDTRYINSLMAYDRWLTHRRPMIKTYLEPGNRLLYVYDKVANDGLVALPDSAVHTLEITACDDAGNRSQLSIPVQRARAEPSGGKITGEILGAAPRRVPMFHDSVNVAHLCGLTVTVPVGGLYRPVWFTVDTLPRPDSSCSPYWRIHTPETPLHRAAQIHLPAAVPEHLRPKAVVASYNSKGDLVASGGAWEGDGVRASITAFGSYFVALDTVPPRIAPQFAPRANMRKREKLSVNITDNLSGISSYHATIDGQWALMEYDAKDDVLDYFFDPARLRRGRTHTLVLTVTDRRFNESTLETQFIW